MLWDMLQLYNTIKNILLIQMCVDIGGLVQDKYDWCLLNSLHTADCGFVHQTQCLSTDSLALLQYIP